MNNTGQIVRSKTNSNFTVIPNEILRNPKMSAKAKGLLCFLLGLPPDWVLYKKTLTEYFSDGKESMSSAWDELVEHGYIVSVRMIGNNNLTTGWNHVVYEQPCKPEQENPETPIKSSTLSEVGFSEIREPVNTKTRHYKDRLNKDLIKESVYTPTAKKRSATTFVPPTVEEVVAYFEQHGYTRELATKAFNYYEVGNWADSKGNKVKNWKQKMQGVWMTPENKPKISSTNLFSDEQRSKYDQLLRKGWKNCTHEELCWVWDYQHRTPTTYIEFPKNELIKTRGNSKTDIEYE